MFSNPLFRGKTLLLAVSMLVAFFACQKDRLEPFPKQINPEVPTSPNYPISLAGAIASFAEFQNTPVSNLGDSTQFLDLEPLWDEASIGYSISGKEILMVPLPDSAFKALNNGRTGARLLFTMSGPDSVTADIVVYVADSAYYQTTAGVMNFNTFTGAYVFYDIAQNFKYLLYADSGAIIGGTDTLIATSNVPALDRVDCGFITVQFETIECTDIPVALQQECHDAYYTANVYLGPCGGNGGGGSGGSGGSGGGGGSGSSYWSAFSGQLPLSYFQENPTALPPGFDYYLFRDLIQVAQKLTLTSGKIGWLINNRTFIPHLANFIENHEQEDGALEYAKDHLNLLVSNPEYREMVKKSFGWPVILWTIAGEVITDKAIDIILNLIPGFNKQDEVRDAIKAISHGDWLEFTYEAGKIVVGQIPWLKAFDVAKSLSSAWIVIDKISDLLDTIGAAKLERAWNIVKNSAVKFSANALKYVNDLEVPKLGGYFATINNYGSNFKAKFSEVQDKIGDVHHALPQVIQSKYPYFNVTNDQMHSLENLRGIPNDGSLDHTTITNYWTGFYNTNPNASFQETMDFVKFIDDEFGHLFVPPIR